MLRVLIISLISIIFILGIIWLVKTSSKKINEALIKASEKLDFVYSPPESIHKEKITSGIIDGYKCEIIVYIQRHGESSTTYVSFVTYFPESLNMGVNINGSHLAIRKETAKLILIESTKL